MQSMVQIRSLWSIALALVLLALPVAASAEPGRESTLESWWHQLGALLTAFVAGAESGPAMDPGGLQSPTSPGDTDSQSDSGPEMDPGG